MVSDNDYVGAGYVTLRLIKPSSAIDTRCLTAAETVHTSVVLAAYVASRYR